MAARTAEVAHELASRGIQGGRSENGRNGVFATIALTLRGKHRRVKYLVVSLLRDNISRRYKGGEHPTKTPASVARDGGFRFRPDGAYSAAG